MITRKELFELYKLQILRDTIGTNLSVIVLIILWYLQYTIFFWIGLFFFAYGGIRWIIKTYKLEKKLGIDREL